MRLVGLQVRVHAKAPKFMPFTVRIAEKSDMTAQEWDERKLVFYSNSNCIIHAGHRTDINHARSLVAVRAQRHRFQVCFLLS